MTTLKPVVSGIRTPENEDAAAILAALGGSGGVARWHSQSLGALLSFVEAGGVLTVPEFMRIMTETLKATEAEVSMLRERGPGAEFPPQKLRAVKS